MTIGVIDECRQMGLGTQMLNHTIGFVESKFPDCICIWLHVVDYNQSAIKFYNKNKFIKFQTLKKHYEIDGRDYDAIQFYRALGRLKTTASEDEES